MKKNLDHNLTDAIITSDEWDNFDYNLRLQIEELANIDYDNKSKEWKKNTLAAGYLYYVEKLLQEAGIVDVHTIGTIKELRKAITNYDGMRIFLQTLRLTTIATRAGIIPQMAHAGVRHSDTQSNKGRKPRTHKGITPQEQEKRNQKIITHYKKASKNEHIKLHGFAVKHADKYYLKPARIKQIIKSSLDT